MGDELPSLLIRLLSGKDIVLKSNEISVRILQTSGGKMIAPIEIEVIAHSFKERVDKQDTICGEIRSYLLEKHPACGDIRVWLQLSELGHSW